jgi:outer membrane protein OmpA-like peptidoglycan-associated protein
MTLTGNAGTAGTLTFSTSGYGSVTSSSFSIAKAPVTVTADAQSVAYGTSAATVTGAGSVSYNGFKGSDTSSVVTGTNTITYTTTYTATTAAETSGVTITPVVTGLSATNYAFTAVNGTVTVTKANQTALTLTSTSGTYGTALTLVTSGGTTAGSVTYAVANGTASTCAESGGSLTSSTAGTCTVTATMAGNGNYNAVSSSATTVTLSARPLTMSGVTAVNKVYDGNRTATLNFGSASLVGVASGDNSSAISFSSSSATGEFASAAVADNVAVTVTGVTLTGTKASSYSLTQPTGVTANITSASRTLSFATTTYGKTYGDAAFTVTATPSAGSGTITYSATGSGCSVNSSSGLVTISSVGACSISASIATDGTYDAASTTTPVSVTVNAKPVTITGMTASNKQFDDTDAATPSFSSATVSGVVGSDSVSVNASGATATFASPDVNTSITVTAAGVSLSGTDSGNYVLSAQPTTTANITTRALVVTAENASIAFGASTPTPSVSAPALQGNDAIGSATYTYAGTGSTTYAASSTAPTAVGTYSITPSAAVFSSGSASNYAISYAAGTFTITKANQTITFASISDTTRAASPLTVAPTASSGLTVTVTSLTTSVCTVSGSSITLLAVGTCTLRASQAGNDSYEAATAVDRSFTVNPGAATALVVTGTASQTAGGTQTVTITAVDSSGDTATGYTGSKTLTFSGASVSPDGTAPTAVNASSSAVAFGSTTALTFSSGVATTSMALYLVESATISVTDGTISSTGADRLSVTVSVGTASKLAVATEPSAGVSGAVLSRQPVVRVVDAYGNLTTSTATVTVTASGGTLGGLQASSGIAAASGVATFTNLTFAGLTTSSYTLTFASTGLTSVTSSSITPTGAGAAATIAVNAGNNQTATAGSAVSAAPSVLVTDAAGNPVANRSVTFAVVTGGGSGTSLTTTSNSSGIATVGSWTLGTTAGANTMTATASGLTGSPVTFTATGVAGVVTRFAVTMSGSDTYLWTSPQVAGTPFSVRVSAQDANYNVNSDWTGTVALTSGGFSGTVNAVITANGYVDGISITPTVSAQRQVIAASSGAITTASASSGYTVRAGPLAGFTVKEVTRITYGYSTGFDITNKTAGAGFYVQVTAIDAYGNAKANINGAYVDTTTAFTGSVTLSSPAGLLDGATTCSDFQTSDGWCIKAIAVGTAGSATVTATEVGGGGNTGTSNSFTVSAGPAATTIITAQPSGGASGALLAGQVSAQIEDGNGNTVATASGSASQVIPAGTSWSAAANGTSSSNIGNIVYGRDASGNPLWVANTGYGVARSTDGTSWTTGSVYADARPVLISYGLNGTTPFWVAYGQSSTCYTSYDAVTWSIGPCHYYSNVTEDAAYGGGTWISVGSAGIYEGNIGNRSIQGGDYNAVAYGAGLFVATQPTGSVISWSRTGTSWTNVTTGTVSNATDIAYGNGLWVITSSSGGVYTSTDGRSWTARSTGASTALNTVTYGGGTWVAAGASGRVATSYDGITWTSSTALASAAWTSSASDGTRILIAQTPYNSSAMTSTIMTSTTSTTGISGTSTATPSSGSLAFSGTQFSGTVGTTYRLGVVGTATSLGGATTNGFTLTGAGTATQLGLSTSAAGFTVGSAFTTQPAVTIRDSSGNTVTSDSTSVITATVSAGASLVGTTTATAVNGVATFTDLGILGTAGTAYTVTFSSGSLTSATQSITPTPGAAASIVISRASVGTASGAAFTTQPQIAVKDALGNTVTSDSTSVVTATVSAGGTLVGTTTRTMSSGVATFTNLGITGTVGTTYTITYSLGAFTPVTATVTVTVGAATTIAVNAGNSQTATAGSAVAIAPSVIVTDSGGNPVSGTAVTFAVASGGGSRLPSTTVSTNSSGIAAVTSWTLGTTAGTNTLTATVSGLSGSPVTFTATGTVGTVTKFAVTSGGSYSAVPSTTTAGTGIGVRVSAQDANGNVNSAWTGTVALTSNAWTGTVNATISANGYVDSIAVTPTSAGASRVIAAASGAITTAAASSTFTVTAGTVSAVKLTVNRSLVPIVAGESFTVTLEPADAYGNATTCGRYYEAGLSWQNAAMTSSGTLTTTGNADSYYGAVSLTTSVTSTDVATLQGTLRCSTPNSRYSGSTPMTVQGANATALSFATWPLSSGVSGSVLSRQPVVRFVDQYANLTTTGTVPVTVTSGGTMTTATSGPSGMPKAVGFGDGRWVSAGYCSVSGGGQGCIWTSKDGVNWYTVSTVGHGEFKSVAYGNGVWLALNYWPGNSNVYRSTDGITWTAVSGLSLGSLSYDGLAYGNGSWVLTGMSGVTKYSRDGGVTWSNATGASGVQMQDVAFGDGGFVGSGTHCSNSPDGITWAVTSCSGGSQIEYGNGIYVATRWTGTRTEINVSSNLSSGWTTAATLNDSVRGLAWTGSVFVLATNGAPRVSSNGLSWVIPGGASSYSGQVLAGGNGMALSPFTGGVLYRFPNALSGTTTVTPTSGSATFSDVAVHGTVGSTPDVAFSGQGKTGTSTTVSITGTGAAYRLELSRQSVGTSSGAAFTTQPQVTVKDLAGNTRTSDSSTVVTATVSSGGTVVGTTTATAVNGVATFSDLGISGTVGSTYEVTYASGSLAAASQIITVTQAQQTITFGTLAGKTFGDTAFTVSATASSGLTVSFASTTTGVCTVSGTTVTIVAAGTCAIRASQAGDASTAAAANVDQSFTVAQAAQTISFGALSGKTYGDAAFAVSATASSGLTVSFASTTTGVCTVSGTTVTIVTAGSCTIRATQAGDGNYLAATAFDRSFTIAQAAQSALTLTSTTGTYGSTVALTTSGGSGTGTVSYAVTTAGSAGCTVSGTTLTAASAGTCDVTATKPADTNYLAESSAATTVTFALATQTISFGALSGKTYGDAAFGISATASSGLTVSFASTTTGVCTVSGTTVTIVTAGTCTIRATQAGNGNYQPASDVDQSFSVARAAQAALTLTSTTGTYGSTIALAVTGGTTAGTVSYIAADDTATGCSVSGSSLTVTGAGTCTVTATMAGDGNWLDVSTSATTVTFAKANQAAVVLTTTSGTFGTGLALAVSGGTTAGSVSYAAADGTASDCVVTAGTLTSTSFGTCTVTATMAGNGNYEPVSSTPTTVTLAKREVSIAAEDKAIVFGNSISQSYTITSGSLAYSDAIASLTYTYVGTGSTSYGPSTTAPTGAGTYSVTPSAASFSTGSASNYGITYTAGAVTIGQASQTITFAQPEGVVYLAAPFAVSPTSSSSLPVTVVSNSASVCTVAAGVVTIVGAGTCSLTASQAGSTDYAAATSVTRTFAVAQANQATLQMTSVSSASYGETISLASSGGSGTGATAYSVTGGSTCTVSGSTLTLGNAGSTCGVRATKVGDSNYNATTSADQTITIGQAGQTLAFTSTVPASPLPNGTYTPTASSISTVTGSSSGVTPTFAVSGACSLASGVVTFTVTGTCTITASAASNTNFTAASNVTQVIAVGSLNQNITFIQPSAKTYGASSFSLGATASSGLTVTYVLGSGTTGYGTAGAACSVSSLGVVTLLDVGTCEAVASQTGDAQYAAASSVTLAFQITAALPTAPTLTSASASSQSITVGFVAPGFSGAPSVSVTGYQLVATPTGSGTTVTSTACTTSPCTISGLVNGTEYTVTVAAINVAGTGPASSASTALTPATAAYAVGALAAIPGNTTVTLTWTALTNAQLGGGTFTHYRISMRPAGTSQWNLVSTALTNQSADNLTIPGLNNGASYDFQVVAITSANQTAIAGNTAEVVEYPSVVPTAPRSLQVLASTATDVQFSWVAPVSDGGAALTNPNYTVTVTGSAGAASVTCTPGGTPAGSNRFCTASNLSNDATYTFSVVATNRMGNSPAATTTYVVPSSDTTLSSLVATSLTGAVPMTPAFTSATTAYTATVTNAVVSVIVTPTTTSGTATVEVNGVAVISASPSSAIPLAVGTNLIEIEVTASDPRFTETYTLTITRAPAQGGGSGGLPTPGIPVTPPSPVVNGGALGAVLENGSIRTDVVLLRTPAGSGWEAMSSDFSLSVNAESRRGAPEPLSSGGVMQVPQGGRIVIEGDGYEPSSEVAVFAIPTSGMRMSAKVALRSVAGTVYLGSAAASMLGTVSASFAVPTNLSTGGYVLQVNGLTVGQKIRSVNLKLDVDAAPAARTTEMREAAFFEGGSGEFSAAGESKLRAMVASIPKSAEGVQVTVVGVSTALDSPRANLDLARDRAERIVQYLEDAGVKGSYTVSVSTTFDIRSGDKAADSAAMDRPMTSSAGKPLTTVGISFTDPGP